MTWEWSHTQEAYDNAYNNLFELLDNDIRIIWAEIAASTRDDLYNYDLNLALYESKLVYCENIACDILINDIWDFMTDYRTCDNGGFNAYCCPFGCHIVSFDKIDSKD